MQPNNRKIEASSYSRCNLLWMYWGGGGVDNIMKQLQYQYITSPFIDWQVVICSWHVFFMQPLNVGVIYYIFTVIFVEKMLLLQQNGDNHIQNFHLGSYIVRYTFGYHVLWWHVCGAIQLFPPYIRRYAWLNTVIPLFKIYFLNFEWKRNLTEDSH